MERALPKYVYDFTEGNKDLKDLLGGKGANLAEMTNLGLPGAARVHDHDRGLQGLPRSRRRAGRAARRGQPSTCEALEQAMGRRLGDPDDPLLVVGALRARSSRCPG